MKNMKQKVQQGFTLIELMIVIAILGLLSGPLVERMPVRRIILSRYREPFFIVWSAFDIVFIAVVVLCTVAAVWLWRRILRVLKWRRAEAGAA